jgi:hypothetical protein
MLKEELIKRSPIRIFEQSIHGGLGKGNLGVFTARKGVGKTACLVHVSIDKLLRDQRVLHISFAEDPHHIETWYEQVFREIARSYKLENVLDNHDQIIRNRMILRFKQADVTLDHVEKSIGHLCEGAGFCPEILIVDGFSFYEATQDDFLFWKHLAEKLDAAIWFSATLHRDNLQPDERGIPAPVNRFYNIFSVIIRLEPVHDHIGLMLLKDHDSDDLERLKLKLDPKTLLIANHRV